MCHLSSAAINVFLHIILEQFRVEMTSRHHLVKTHTQSKASSSWVLQGLALFSFVFFQEWKFFSGLLF